MQRIVIIGAGQLGSALAELGTGDAMLLDRDKLDITRTGAIEPFLRSLRPEVLVNAAAYNRVDEAETKPDLAFAVNAIAPGALARAAVAIGARFVHVSTDYVFPGDSRTPYKETDETAPLGAYAASKLAGEHLVRAYAPEALVVRTSSVFGSRQGRNDHNFVATILRRARAGAALRVVADKTASPTYAVDLGRAILSLLERNASGIVHIANAGSCTWYEFAQVIVAGAGLQVSIEPIATASSGDAARRPAYSVLDLSRLETFGISMPHWRDALRRYMLSTGDATTSDAVAREL